MTLSAPTVVEAGSSAQPLDLADRLTARRWERAYLVLFVMYVGLGFTVRSFGWIHGDGAWFVQAARRVLDGSFDVYSFRVETSAVPVSGAAYNISPLLAILIAPFVGLADWLGWGQEWAERLMALPLLVADVLAMRQLRLLVREWRPAADERLVFLGILLSLCLTSFWVVSAFGGHDEGLVLLFLLLALRVTPRNLLLGGAYAGLAVAAKQTAAFCLLPVGLALLASGALAARSAGLLARRNRSVWLIRSRASVMTMTGPSCCVTLVRGTASGREPSIDRSGVSV